MTKQMIDRSPNTGRYRLRELNEVYNYWATIRHMTDEEAAPFVNAFGLNQEWDKTKTKFGYLHSHYGEDMDGSHRDFEWIADEPQEGDTSEPGWFAMCTVEPEAGWIGPCATEAEAIHAATTEEGFRDFQWGLDPMGDHHGRNE